MTCNLNLAGAGVHEIAVLRDGTLVAGHFDNAPAADAALAALENYQAVWSTLNPLASLPGGRTLNPTGLTRGSRAKAQHIERRTSLMFDFDADKPAGVMATQGEREATLTQARDCRAWLLSMGWPLLPICDSGSGTHLRPYVDLPATEEVTELIRRTLTGLKTRFPRCDGGVSDLPRLCRYYGGWNRKGPYTTDRPWRQSSVIDAGEQTIVTAPQLEALCDLLKVPVLIESAGGPDCPETVAKLIRRFVAYAEEQGAEVLAIHPPDREGRTIIDTAPCLLHDDHVGGVGFWRDGRRSVQCFHDRCKSLGWARWSKAVEAKFKQPMRLEGEIRWRK